jgi:hypothetical protein
VTNRFAPKQQPTTNKTTKKCCLLIIILLYNIFSPTFVTDLPSVLDTRQPSSLSHLDPPLSLHKTTKQKTNDRAQHQNNVHENNEIFEKKTKKIPKLALGSSFNRLRGSTSSSFVVRQSFHRAQWHALGREEQSKYYELARKERQVHMQLHPGWTARDNYAQGKKRKRRREKPSEAGGN